RDARSRDQAAHRTGRRLQGSGRTHGGVVVTKRGPKRRRVGEVVHISYGCDARGGGGGIEHPAGVDPNASAQAGPTPAHGPFPTEAEAQRASEVATFGPDCEFKDGGRWDPAWEKKQ